MSVCKVLFLLFRGFFVNRSNLILENLALRQQLTVQQQTIKRPKLKRKDRIFWAWLLRIWPQWKSALIVVKPETVIKWHRQGFKLYWCWKSRPSKVGRPRISKEIYDLIRQMSQENPTWGAPIIQSELKLLGFEIADSTVAKYMVRQRKPPSQTWRAFLRNHVKQTAAIDFFTVPTVRFQILYCFIVLRHHRRQIVHFNVTMHPTARWTAQQITEAFPYDTAPKYLIRDRDGIYGTFFEQRVENIGIKEVLIAPKSPWQNPYCERVIGSIRRECLDHMIILSENHLCRILKDYMDYYNNCRTHLSLNRNSPSPRDIEPPSRGKVISIPQVGGLHHVYKRVA
ncbi:MAG: transposase [Deltaproteobacteria bacterium]|nr:transposase [Deltaproteobacteria bacterium]